MANSAWVHPVALVLALAVVTMLHMTVGEQAPKMWAINRAEGTALNTAYPLQVFATVLRPLIWLISVISNSMVRLAGLSAADVHQNAYDIAELRAILVDSARSGNISTRQRMFGENILSLANLEVRHIMVPRTEVAYLSTGRSDKENLQTVRETGHSRYPLGATDLDHTTGLIHARDVLGQLLAGEQPDLKDLARELPFVPDTQPLSRFILDLARIQTHCAVVVDEHGTAVGMAFLEDAIEEIVGPIDDEFDERQEGIDSSSDTVGGWIVAKLGRLPRVDDAVEIGGYRATVAVLRGRLIGSVRFERIGSEPEPPAR